MSIEWTTLSYLVVKRIVPSWNQMPSPPGKTVAPCTCSRVGFDFPLGSGTSFQVTDPSSATTAASSFPADRSG